MVSDIVRSAEVARALDPGLTMGEGDEQRLSSNSDKLITLYSMIDGEPRPILAIDAQRVLQKRLPDGRPAFWMEGMIGSPPAYKRGNVMCYLHPQFSEVDGPAGFDRAWIDSIGLSGRECNMSDVSKPNKADFRSVFDRDAHMRRAHRDELRIIIEAQARRREMIAADERRQDREAMLTLARAGMQQAPAVAWAPEEPRPAKPQVTCELCGYTNTQGNVNRHKAQKHR